MRTKSRLLLVTLCTTLMAFSAVVSAETHWNLQAVDSIGGGTWTDNPSYPVTVTGVILNNHEEMLDPTSDCNQTPWNMGAEWQIFIQPTDPADHAGTALYMGQNYGNLPWINPDESHTAEEWYFEMNRLNYDNGNPFTGHHFRAGDLVEVVAPNVLFYGGKTNINEGHSKAPGSDPISIPPGRDFTISLTTADYGLPMPEDITLADLYVDPESDYPLFDSSRLSGGEYYQGRRVLLNGLTLTDSSGWGQEEWGDRICTVAGVDEVDFKLRMPRGSMVDLGSAPAGEFDVIGIVNQESGSGDYGRDGYELFVSEVLMPGDVNRDGWVSGDDLTIIISHWGQSGLGRDYGDLNSNGTVDGPDYTEVLSYWGTGTPPPEPPSGVPEPATVALLLTGGLALLRLRKK